LQSFNKNTRPVSVLNKLGAVVTYAANATSEQTKSAHSASTRIRGVLWPNLGPVESRHTTPERCVWSYACCAYVQAPGTTTATWRASERWEGKSSTDTERGVVALSIWPASAIQARRASSNVYALLSAIFSPPAPCYYSTAHITRHISPCCQPYKFSPILQSRAIAIGSLTRQRLSVGAFTSLDVGLSWHLRSVKGGYCLRFCASFYRFRALQCLTAMTYIITVREIMRTYWRRLCVVVCVSQLCLCARVAQQRHVTETTWRIYARKQLLCCTMAIYGPWIRVNLVLAWNNVLIKKQSSFAYW